MSANQWGRELRAARIAEGDTQEEAGRRLGLHRSNVSRLERGEYEPTLSLARRAQDIYHVPLRLLAVVPSPAEERQAEAVAS